MPDGLHKTSTRIGGATVIFVLGTVVGYVLGTLPIRSRVGAGLPGDFLRIFGLGSLTWYACLLSSPLYLWLARRIPIQGRRWARNLAVHAAITTAMVLITGTIYLQLLKATNGGIRVPSLGGFLLLRLLTESLPFWAMIALIHAFDFKRRHRLVELKTAQLQTQLAQARLEALTAQLQPHFLFNTMQGISTLMHRDVRAADAMLSRLSDLLRETLQRGERRESPLFEEMEMLNHYVEICRERFKDRLIFEVDVSPEARRAMVPFFILQPLVENALQHGIARRSGVGRVSVRARRDGDTLCLNVTDDGPGLDAAKAAAAREGIGLSNTRERLRELYGNAQELTLDTPVDGGLKVNLVIPFRTSPAPEPQKVAS